MVAVCPSANSAVTVARSVLMVTFNPWWWWNLIHVYTVACFCCLVFFNCCATFFACGYVCSISWFILIVSSEGHWVLLVLFCCCTLSAGYVRGGLNLFERFGCVCLFPFYSRLKCFVDFGVISVHDSGGAADRWAEEDIRHVCCLVVSPSLFHRAVLAKRLQRCSQKTKGTPVTP